MQFDFDKQTNEMTLILPYDQREKARRIWNSKWDPKNKIWRVPFDPWLFKQIEAKFPEAEFSPDLKEAFKQEAGRLAKIYKLRKMKEIDPAQFDCATPAMKTKAFKHQEVAFHFGLLKDRYAIFDQLGLGKTFEALNIAMFKKHAPQKIERLLIICPNSVKFNWGDEIEKHTGEAYEILDGSTGKKKKLIATAKEFAFAIIVNYESVRLLVDELKDWVDGQMLILDEVHRAKNMQAQVTKAIYELNPKYVISMTGTPVANLLPDIYAIIQYISPNLLGRSFWHFGDRYLVYGGFDQKEIVNYKNLDELKQKVASVSIRRLKRDVLDLPEKTYTYRTISMSKDQGEAYMSMKDEFRAWVKEKNEEQILISAPQVLVRLIRLSQIADGFITDDELKNPVFFADNPKIKELIEILNEVIENGGKAVIFSRFVPITCKLPGEINHAISKAICTSIWGGVKPQQRHEIINEFQSSENGPNVLSCQIHSCSLGINLHAASTMVFFDNGLISGADRTQAEGRIHRIGQTAKKITIIDLIAKNTIDQHWYGLIKKKRRMADKVLGDKGEEHLNKAELLEVLQ